MAAVDEHNDIVVHRIKINGVTVEFPEHLSACIVKELFGNDVGDIILRYACSWDNAVDYKFGSHEYLTQARLCVCSSYYYVIFVTY